MADTEDKNLVYRNGQLVERDDIKEEAYNKGKSVSQTVINKTNYDTTATDFYAEENWKINEADSNSSALLNKEYRNGALVGKEEKENAEESDFSGLKKLIDKNHEITEENFKNLQDEREDLLKQLQNSNSEAQINDIKKKLEENKIKLSDAEKEYTKASELSQKTNIDFLDKSKNRNIKAKDLRLSNRQLELAKQEENIDKSLLKFTPNVTSNGSQGPNVEQKYTVIRNGKPVSEETFNRNKADITAALGNHKEKLYRNGKLVSDYDMFESKKESWISRQKNSFSKWQSNNKSRFRGFINKQLGKTAAGRKLLSATNAINDFRSATLGKAVTAGKSFFSKMAKQTAQNAKRMLKILTTIFKFLISNPVGHVILLFLIIFVVWLKSPEPQVTITDDPVTENISMTDVKLNAWSNVFDEATDEFYEQYHVDIPPAYISAILNKYSDNEEIEKYVADYAAGGSKNSEITALYEAESNDYWIEIYTRSIKNYLSNGGYDTDEYINELRELFLKEVVYEYQYLYRIWSDKYTLAYPSEIDTKITSLEAEQTKLDEEAQNHDEIWASEKKVTLIKYKTVDDWGYVTRYKTERKCTGYGSRAKCSNEQVPYQNWEVVGSHEESYKESATITTYEYRDILEEGWTSDETNSNIETNAKRESLTEKANKNAFSWETDFATYNFILGFKRSIPWEDRFIEGDETSGRYINDTYVDGYENYNYNYKGQERIIKQIRRWTLVDVDENGVPTGVYHDVIYDYNPETDNDDYKEEIFTITKDDPKWNEPIEIEINKRFIFREYYENETIVVENYWTEENKETYESTLKTMCRILLHYWHMDELSGIELNYPGIYTITDSYELWAKIDALSASHGNNIYGAKYNCTKYSSYRLYLAYGITNIAGHGRQKVDCLMQTDVGKEKFVKQTGGIPKANSLYSINWGDGSYGHTGWIDEVFTATDTEDGKIIGETYVRFSDGNVGGAHQIREGAVVSLTEWQSMYGSYITYAIPKEGVSANSYTYFRDSQ